jgi:toxin-antitoxin system PIN domain toxin
MSSTIDANILLYASDASSPLHHRAQQFVSKLAAGPDLVYLFWPALMAYLRIATHPAIFEAPLDPETASANVERLIRLPHVRTESETDRFWDVWRATAPDVVPRGNAVPDTHLVALMRLHGVATIWTRDRDFRRFDRIRVEDPFS